MRPHLTLMACALLPAPALAQTIAAQTGGSQDSGASATVGTLLDVQAEGRVSRVPDVATIRAGVVAQAPTAVAALADQATRMARVLASLKRAGVLPRDIATATIGLSPQYRYTDGQPPAITGYQATNSVSVRFRDIAHAGGILDALVAAGANQIDGPELAIDQPDAALDEARVAAIKTARARAELYARAAGLHVRRIVSIGEGGANPGAPQPPMLYARAKAQTEIAPGEKNLTVTVNVRFLLD